MMTEQDALAGGDNDIIGIVEAAKALGLEPHILNFWESLFPELSPQVRGGRRYYDANNMELLRLIYKLLVVENNGVGTTRKKVQQLAEQIGASTIEPPHDNKASHDNKTSAAEILSFGEAKQAKLCKTIAKLEQIRQQLDKVANRL